MSKYLSEELIRNIHVYNGKDYSYEITIKELLSHTSGIADYYDEKSYKDNKNIFELYLEYPEKSWTEIEKIERVRNDMKPSFKPGTDASYSDTNFLLLEKIIETITNKPINIFYEEYFFHPLGLKSTQVIGYSKPQITQFAVPSDVFYKDINITKIRSNKAYSGSLISTAEEMIIFLKALNEGKIISKETLKLMKKWHKLDQFPIQYGHGMMYFKFPWFINMKMKIPPLYGHSGSIGSFLYYSEDLNLYIAGTINQAKSKSKPFSLIQDVIKVIKKWS